MDRQARTRETVLVKIRGVLELNTAVVAVVRRGKDDRKQNTLAALAPMMAPVSDRVGFHNTYSMLCLKRYCDEKFKG
jgi:hypothetical protein